MRRSSLVITSLVSVALSVGLLVAVPAPARADQGAFITLDAVLEAGRRNHPTLAKQPLLGKSLKLQREQLNRAYWPQLSLGGAATWQSDVTSISIPVPGAMIEPPPKDQYRLTLDLHQSIWDGGAIAQQKRVAATRTQIESEKVELEWYQVRESILQLYFAGVVQQELRQQGEMLDARMQVILDKVKLSVAKGVATERDALLVQAQKLEVHQAIADAKAQLTSVRRSLEDLTGAPLADDVALRSSDERCQAAPDPHPQASEIHRPELAVLAAQGQLLTAQEKLERAGDRPRLGAFATAGYGRPGLNALNNSFDSYFIGGVQLTVPLTYLYAGTRGKSREQLEVQRSILARQEEAVVKQVHVQLDTQNAEFLRLESAVLLDDELVELRERARAQTEVQVSLGTATVSDLINDLSQEDQARSRRAIHRAQRDLACHQLALITGDL